MPARDAFVEEMHGLGHVHDAELPVEPREHPAHLAVLDPRGVSGFLHAAGIEAGPERVELAAIRHQAGSPKPRCVPFSRASAIATYSASFSIRIQSNPSISHARAVVPLPPNGSSTMPPGGVTRRTRWRMRSTGFTVG